MEPKKTQVARVIKRGMNSEAEYKPSQNVLVERLSAPKEYTMTLAEQVAGTRSCHFNYRWNGAETDFPSEPWMRTVRRFFESKNLAVEEPRLENEVLTAERKRKAMKRAGIRFLVIKPGMTFENCLEAIDELDDGDIRTSEPARGRADG